MAKKLVLSGESKTNSNSRLPETEAFNRSVWTRQLLSFSVGASSQDRHDEVRCEVQYLSAMRPSITVDRQHCVRESATCW